MVNSELFNVTTIEDARSEAGKLRDELGYQRVSFDASTFNVLSSRVTAYLEFGIDLRCQADQLIVQS